MQSGFSTRRRPETALASTFCAARTATRPKKPLPSRPTRPSTMKMSRRQPQRDGGQSGRQSSPRRGCKLCGVSQIRKDCGINAQLSLTIYQSLFVFPLFNHSLYCSVDLARSRLFNAAFYQELIQKEGLAQSGWTAEQMRNKWHNMKDSRERVYNTAVAAAPLRLVSHGFFFLCMNSVRMRNDLVSLNNQ